MGLEQTWILTCLAIKWTIFPYRHHHRLTPLLFFIPALDAETASNQRWLNVLWLLDNLAGNDVIIIEGIPAGMPRV